MIDGNPVQVELPAATNVAAQRKAAASTDERSCFFDSVTNNGHAPGLTGELTANPVCLWYYEKLRIDFGSEPSIVRRMAKPSNDEVRELFTEIGCIMEDASLIALVWGADDEIDVTARYQKILDAQEKISQLLLQIESAG